MKLFKYPFIVVFLACLLMTSFGVGFAITGLYTKTIVGVANISYHLEVPVVDTKIAGQSKIKVVVQSVVTTEADYVYTVVLYLNFEDVIPTQTVSFTAGEIPGTKKIITFTGLDLSLDPEIGAEVIR